MRILVIEDDPTVGQYVKRGLEEQRWAVDLVADGEEGERRASSEAYDLIILDMRLPGKSGLEVLHVAPRAAGSSGRSSCSRRRTRWTRRSRRFAPAPTTTSRSRSPSRSCSRGSKRSRAGRARSRHRCSRVGDLELDQATREVRRGGEPIELTPKEYTVLEYLMRHAGRVMSRTLITEYAWGYHFDPGTNIVDVVINHLRKKIDARPRPEADHDRAWSGLRPEGVSMATLRTRLTVTYGVTARRRTARLRHRALRRARVDAAETAAADRRAIAQGDQVLQPLRASGAERLPPGRGAAVARPVRRAESACSRGAPSRSSVASPATSSCYDQDGARIYTSIGMRQLTLEDRSAILETAERLEPGRAGRAAPGVRSALRGQDAPRRAPRLHARCRRSRASSPACRRRWPSWAATS